MDEKLEIQEMSIDELKVAIETLQAEIDEHKAELDDINTKLGESDMAGESEPVYNEPEAPQPEDEDPEIAKLKARKEELISLITEKQMQLVAMQKRLNDLLADEAMNNYNEEE